MDPLIDLQKEKYREAAFKVSKRLAHVGYNLKKPAYTLTWEQIAREVGRVLVDQGIEPDQVSAETLSGLVDEVREVLFYEDILHWRQVIRIRISSLESTFPENQEPDEGVLSESFENATRLGDEEGYWVDGGASADLFDE